MSKMSEMAAAIEDLRRCAAAIGDAADWLSVQFSSDEAKPEEAKAVKPLPDESAPIQPSPVNAPIALEAVRAVLANKSRAGYTAQIRSLLQKYGTDKLSGVDPANYKALLADAEELNNAT